jgi:hypothetical protein
MAGFSSIGRGSYYYLSGMGTLAKRRDTIPNFHPHADRNGTIEILMTNYKVGDVRFYCDLFAPGSLSVFGWRWH